MKNSENKNNEVGFGETNETTVEKRNGNEENENSATHTNILN